MINNDEIILIQWQDYIESFYSRDNFKGQDLVENVLKNVNSVEEYEIGPPILGEEFDRVFKGLRMTKLQYLIISLGKF